MRGKGMSCNMLTFGWPTRQQSPLSLACRTNRSMTILQEAKSLAAFIGWPLLPVAGSRLHQLLPLPQSPVICAGPEWPKQLATALQKLGC